MASQANAKTNRPHDAYGTFRFCLKTHFFSSDFAYRPLVFGENDHRVTYLFKNALQSEDFWKRWPLVYVWTDENAGFRIRWRNAPFTASMTHALQGMLSYFHCLAFSYGRAKTIRIRYVWTRIFLKTEENISVCNLPRCRIKGPLLAGYGRINLYTIETFSANRQDKTNNLNINNWFGLLALEPVEVEPYISRSEDNVQCILCLQDPCSFKNQIATHHWNYPVNMQHKVHDQLCNWKEWSIEPVRTQLWRSMETSQMLIGAYWKGLHANYSFSLASWSSVFKSQRKLFSFVSLQHIEINHQNLLMWDL